MEILKCNADFDKIYYVVFNNTLCQCKLIRTFGQGCRCFYVLDIAGYGIQTIPFQRFENFNMWYHGSSANSILYNSIEDYKNRKPIIDNYGATDNCYNSGFINPLFKYVLPCNCGGSTYTWKWDGCKSVKYIVSTSNQEWYWDKDGFHSALNGLKDSYKSAKECENNSKLVVVTF